MLSDDDVNLGEMSDEELEAAWDLWFDLAQTTNESDPPYTHGALAYTSMDVSAKERPAAPRLAAEPTLRPENDSARRG
jgi:hypothetical protein